MTHELLFDEEPSLELDLHSAESLAAAHLHDIAESRERLWHVKELARPTNGEHIRTTLQRVVAVQEFYSDGAVAVTPLEQQSDTEQDVFFKDERYQRVRSFKIRGAFWASLQAFKKNPHMTGTAQATAGNAGQGGAAYAEWHNRNEPRSITAHTFMPHSASKVKKDALRARDAVIHDHDPATGQPYETLHDAKAGARRFAESHEQDDSATIALLDPYAHPDTIAGQGTLMLETYLQLREAGADLLGRPTRIRVGGGGLGLAIGCAEALQALMGAGLVHSASYVEVTQESHTDATLRAVEQLAKHGVVNLDTLFATDHFSASNDGTAVEVPDRKNVAAAYQLSLRGALVLRRVAKQSVARAMAHRPGNQDLEPAGSLGLASHLEDTSTISAYLGYQDDGHIDVVVLSGGNVSESTKNEYTAALDDRSLSITAMGSAVTRRRVEIAHPQGVDPEVHKIFKGQLSEWGVELLD